MEWELVTHLHEGINQGRGERVAHVQFFNKRLIRYRRLAFL